MHVMVIPEEWEAPITRQTIEGKLEDLQKIVDGYIEFVDVESRECSIICNEEGLIRSLPLNERATAFLWRNAPEHLNQTVFVGDVIVVGLIDDEGDTTECPEDIFAEFGV